MSHSRSDPLPLHSHLQQARFLHFRRTPSLRLQAECGTLWVAVDGEPRDIVIEAGQSRVFDGHAPITVGTFDADAVLSATPLQPPTTRLRRWWMAAAARLARPAHEVLP